MDQEFGIAFGLIDTKTSNSLLDSIMEVEKLVLESSSSNLSDAFTPVGSDESLQEAEERFNENEKSMLFDSTEVRLATPEMNCLNPTVLGLEMATQTTQSPAVSGNHMKLEKRRRDSIAEAFDVLDCVINPHSRRMNRVDLLHYSLVSLRVLCSRAKVFREEISKAEKLNDSLRDEIVKIRTRNQKNEKIKA